MQCPWKCRSSQALFPTPFSTSAARCGIQPAWMIRRWRGTRFCRILKILPANTLFLLPALTDDQRLESSRQATLVASLTTNWSNSEGAWPSQSHGRRAGEATARQKERRSSRRSGRQTWTHNWKRQVGRLHSLRQSWTWQIGRLLVGPMAWAKRSRQQCSQALAHLRPHTAVAGTPSQNLKSPLPITVELDLWRLGLNEFLLLKAFRRLSLRESGDESTLLSRSEGRQSGQPALSATETNEGADAGAEIGRSRSSILGNRRNSSVRMLAQNGRKSGAAGSAGKDEDQAVFLGCLLRYKLVADEGSSVSSHRRPPCGLRRERRCPFHGHPSESTVSDGDDTGAWPPK